MGPTIIMIKEMLKDLLRFLFIAVFVVLGVGIYYHANIWPDHQSIWSDDWNNWRIWPIIYFPYWQLYAELNLDTLDANCTKNRTIWENDPSKNGCLQEDWTVQAIAGIYVLFSSLLLVNLVIAMFRVRENSEKLWHFQRYTVICDYNRRIPSPFNLIPRLVQLIFLLKRDCSCDIKIGHTEIDLMNTKEKRKKSALQKNFQKIISFRSYNTK
uniref:Ion transport domain-containing protein n=1 Tax=Magallana gigas TaxID=29159 RepID=A0A8W8J6Q0_MAGGI